MTALRLKDATRTQIQRAQKLHRREQRTRHGQFLVEGPQAVREVLAHRPDLVRDLYATESALGCYTEIRELAVSHRVWTHLVSEEDFRDLSMDGQGLVVVANAPEPEGPATVLSGVSLAMATVATADPGNLGTIVRTADAAGAGAVLIGSRSAELLSPKVVRSTAGSLFHLRCISGLTLEQIAEYARAAGMQVLAAEGAGQWELSALQNNAYEAELLGANIDGPDLRRPTLWVLGNEAHGFDDVDLSLVDATVSIPLYGSAESLNVSTAGAVCVYASAMIQNAASAAS
ncbi:RNA methyltransferase [Actinomycetaceae bacterium L2_0104]